MKSDYLMSPVRRWARMAVFLYLACVAASAPQVWAESGQASSDTRSFQISQGGQVTVEISAGEVRVATWTRQEVVVRSVGLRIASLSIQQRGNGVRIGDPRDGGWHGDARLEINVPRVSNLDLRTSFGDISLKGDLQGRFSAVTSAGDIEFDGVEGFCDVSTAGGDIEGGDINGDADLRTSGGEIHVRDVSGRLEARTAGGEIRVGRVGGDVEARTAGGDVSVREAGGKAELVTAGGDVDLGRVVSKADLRTSGGDIDVRESSGPVTARTAGGDVEISSARQWVRASTAGGDISVRLFEPAASGSSELKTSGGDVEIWLPATAAVTIQARIRLGRWERDDDYDIHSDFPADSEDRRDNEINATYVLNGGGQTVRLESVHGSIYIRRLSEQ
ncbi:MAG TPA: DUF4097 family beta strand repeat-containing protein [Acidobacteriota bacterium]|nr:DUF4097 family beta strand repeat-containing protein [Acidobacteriota bacterium]